MNINIEYSENKTYPKFFKKVEGKNIAVICDVNTEPYAENIINKLSKITKSVTKKVFPDKTLIPDENACNEALKTASNNDYLLAVGSGTLNDIAKDVSTMLKIPCGVLATAPSMDGYASKGAALMKGEYKITDDVNAPEDILIDTDIICSAPKIMIAAGVGDILGKFTCLTDWKLSTYLTNESYNEKAADLMKKAVEECYINIEGIILNKAESVAKLMDALITAGLSMAMCGNSRPASGSEHHMSHFLEMDFIKKGGVMPLHGIKVGIATLISLELYNYLLRENVKFYNCERVYDLVKELPKIEKIKDILIRLNCPVRMSDIGVTKDVMIEMIDKAYLVRDRFTILTLIHNLNLSNKIKPLIMDKYF